MTTRTPLYRRPLLLDAGFTDRELARMHHTGELTRVRRGAYLAGAHPDDLNERHRSQARAAMGELGPGSVLSHVSAAALHGLPTWLLPLGRVTVTRDRRSGGRRDQRLHMRTASLTAAEVVLVDGMPVTSVARTVSDLARTVPFECGVVIADSALAHKAVSLEDLRAVLHGCRGWPGCPKARRVIAFADARSESVGESRSRVAIAGAGLPRPVPQFEVRDGAGRLIGRSDFGWPDHQVVGEFDGRVKYGRLVPDGQAPGDVVFAEKRREDDIRAQGVTVVPWTWQDLTNFARIATRLHRALLPHP